MHQILTNPMQYMNADGLKPNGGKSRIAQVQAGLNTNFGANIEVNGIWDTATEAALKKAGYNTKQLSEANIAEITSGNISNYITLPKTVQELHDRVAQHQMAADYSANRETLDKKYGSRSFSDFIAKAAKDYAVKTPAAESYAPPVPTDEKKPAANGKKTIMGIPRVPFIIGSVLLAALAISGTIYFVRRHHKPKQAAPAVKYTITT